MRPRDAYGLCEVCARVVKVSKGPLEHTKQLEGLAPRAETERLDPCSRVTLDERESPLDKRPALVESSQQVAAVAGGGRERTGSCTGARGVVDQAHCFQPEIPVPAWLARKSESSAVSDAQCDRAIHVAGQLRQLAAL